MSVSPAHKENCMHDVIVTGSGPLGAVVARRCHEAGASVLLIEEGGPISEPAGSHVRNAARFAQTPDSYLPAIAPFLSYFNSRAGDAGLPGACITAAYGGQGVLWTNNCPRPTPRLELDDQLSESHWSHLLDLAESYLGVTSNQFDSSVRQRRIAEYLAGPLAATGRAILPQAIAGHFADPTHNRIHWNATIDILGPVEGGIDHRRGKVARLSTLSTSVSGVELADGECLYARAVVVAAGAFGTPMLLHASDIRPAALGRYLTYHVVLISQVVLDPKLCAAGNGSDLVPRLWIPPTAAAEWNTMILRDVNPLVPSGLDLHVEENRLVEIQSFSPVDVREENAMRIGDDGMVSFEVGLSAADQERMKRVLDDQRQLAGLIGRFRYGCEPQWMTKGFAHVMGSCRMGEDVATSVVDANARVHGYENLFLASVGVLPSRVIVNPTLTGAALAVRTADAVAASLRG
jgi:choline dehydrogenase-like flavoprotein